VAYAGARFVNSLLKAQLTSEPVVECTYVKSDAAEGLEYFSTMVELGPDGVKKIHPLPKMSEHEKGLYAAAVPELKGNIKKGVEFVAAAK
jgi:malate dehydrogenase